MDTDEFLEEVCKDPGWLIHCLSSGIDELDCRGELTFLVYTHTGILKLHNMKTHPYYMKDQLCQWLKDMKEAGHPVCFNDLRFKDRTAKDALFPYWIMWFVSNQKEAS